MTEENVKRMTAYFAEEIAACAQREQALAADERHDEATFEKIRANVYDIFRTVLTVAVQQGQGDEAAVRTFFVQKLDAIPQNWESARRAAASHQDTVKMTVEQIKLETVAHIRAALAERWAPDA